jgi:hypothetical protein
MNMTKWHNPLHTEQRVTLAGREIVIPAGGSAEIDPRFDSAIHAVVCGHQHPRCSVRGICSDLGNAPATAMVVGGLAPLLVREGQKYGASRRTA